MASLLSSPGLSDSRNLVLAAMEVKVVKMLDRFPCKPVSKENEETVKLGAASVFSPLSRHVDGIPMNLVRVDEHFLNVRTLETLDTIAVQGFLPNVCEEHIKVVFPPLVAEVPSPPFATEVAAEFLHLLLLRSPLNFLHLLLLRSLWNEKRNNFPSLPSASVVRANRTPSLVTIMGVLRPTRSRTLSRAGNFVSRECAVRDVVVKGPPKEGFPGIYRDIGVRSFFKLVREHR
ncbi:hypothetical protein Ancab_038097 [Ancistrocladus abbreviatus]